MAPNIDKRTNLPSAKGEAYKEAKHTRYDHAPTTYSNGPVVRVNGNTLASKTIKD